MENVPTMTKTSMIAVVDACCYHFWMLPRDIARRVNEEMLPWFILSIDDDRFMKVKRQLPPSVEIGRAHV